LKRVYENQKYLFIVYEYYKGESLYNLLKSGFQLSEVQVASVTQLFKSSFVDNIPDPPAIEIPGPTLILSWVLKSVKHPDKLF
jgi:hypothetical protein